MAEVVHEEIAAIAGAHGIDVSLLSTAKQAKRFLEQMKGPDAHAFVTRHNIRGKEQKIRRQLEMALSDDTVESEQALPEGTAAGMKILQELTQCNSPKVDFLIHILCHRNFGRRVLEFATKNRVNCSARQAHQKGRTIMREVLLAADPDMTRPQLFDEIERRIIDYFASATKPSVPASAEV